MLAAHKSPELILGQRLMGEIKWEKGVETAISCGFLRFPAVSCSFLRLQTTYLGDQGPKLQKSAKIFDKLPFLPFSLAHLALPWILKRRLQKVLRRFLRRCLVVSFKLTVQKLDV